MTILLKTFATCFLKDLRGNVVRAGVTGLHPRLFVAKYLERQTRRSGGVRSLTELTNPQTLMHVTVTILLCI